MGTGWVPELCPSDAGTLYICAQVDTPRLIPTHTHKDILAETKSCPNLPPFPSHIHMKNWQTW